MNFVFEKYHKLLVKHRLGLLFKETLSSHASLDPDHREPQLQLASCAYIELHSSQIYELSFEGLHQKVFFLKKDSCFSVSSFAYFNKALFYFQLTPPLSLSSPIPMVLQARFHYFPHIIALYFLFVLYLYFAICIPFLLCFLDSSSPETWNSAGENYLCRESTNVNCGYMLGMIQIFTPSGFQHEKQELGWWWWIASVCKLLLRACVVNPLIICFHSLFFFVAFFQLHSFTRPVHSNANVVRLQSNIRVLYDYCFIFNQRKCPAANKNINYKQVPQLYYRTDSVGGMSWLIGN